MGRWSITKNTLSGGVILAVAGAYYLGTRQIAHSSLDDGVGADGMPLILSAMLAALALLLILRSLLVSRSKTAGRTAADADDPSASVPRALGFLLIGFGYAVVAPIIGYIPAIALLIAAVGMYEGLRPSRHLAVVALAGAAGFWLLFVWLLGVEQPSSILF